MSHFFRRFLRGVNDATKVIGLYMLLLQIVPFASHAHGPHRDPTIALQTQDAPDTATTPPTETDDGDFDDDPGDTPDNADSETVPGLGMRQPSYAGSGCPAGTLSAILSPDQRTLSVLFDQYIARAGQSQDRATVNCRIEIPFVVPAGYRVKVVKLDYRGFTHVPQGARTAFTAGFRFNHNARGPIRTIQRKKVFAGPLEKNFKLTSRIRGEAWSPCGDSFTLEAISRLHAQSNPAGEDVLTTIDSLDSLAQPSIYHLKWKKCRNEKARPEHRR